MQTFIVPVGIALAFLIVSYDCAGSGWTRRLEASFVWSHRRGAIGYGLLAIIAIVLLPGLSRPSFGLINTILLLNFAWITLSLLWADDRRLCAKRIAQGAIVTGAAIGISYNYQLDEFASLFAMCTGVFLAVGVVEGLRRGQFIDKETRRFGLFGVGGDAGPQKQSTNCVLFFLSTMYLIEIGRLPVLMGVPMVLVALSLLALTRSRNATWSGSGASLIWIGFGIVDGAGVLPWLILSVFWLWFVVGIVAIAVPHKGYEATLWQALFHIGRKPGELKTLNLRIPLWKFCWQRARERWVCGYGYGCFWTRKRSAAAADWKPGSCHCAYLDVLVETGCIGLVLFIGLMGATSLAALWSTSPDRHYLIAMLAFLSAHGILDSTLILRDFETFVYLTVTLYIGNLVTV